MKIHSSALIERPNRGATITVRVQLSSLELTRFVAAQRRLRPDARRLASDTEAAVGGALTMVLIHGERTLRARAHIQTGDFEVGRPREL